MNANARKNPDTFPELLLEAPRARLSAPTDEGPVACTVKKPVTLIGSRRDCDLPLPHPDVSRVHCAIVNTGRALLVRDLLSRSGTSFNDQALRRGVLTGNVSMRVGPIPVTVELLPAQAGSGQGCQDPGGDALRMPTPLVLEMGGRRIRIAAEATVLGRRNTADLMIDTSDVSLAHALLFTLDGHPVIFDLGSRSGTYLNGRRIELAWLNDGDELAIGGECLTVRWSGSPAVTDSPADALRTANAEPVSHPAHESQKLGEMSELEVMIGSIQSQIAAARARVDAQARELEERKSELARRAEAIQARNEALWQTESELQGREAKAAAAEQAAQEKLAALAEREGSLEQQRAALEAQAARIDEQRASLENERSALVAEQERVQTERATLEEERNTLDSAAEEWSRRDDDMHRREEELTAQQAALAEREAREADAFQKIAQFKAALSEASALCDEHQPPADPETAPAAEQSPSSPDGPPAPADSGESEPADTSATPESDDADEGLPAPVVDQPLFAPADRVPPPDWPPELCARFRTLRRASDRSDSDLLAQVWAERDRAVVADDADQQSRKRKRRLIWGN